MVHKVPVVSPIDDLSQKGVESRKKSQILTAKRRIACITKEIPNNSSYVRDMRNPTINRIGLSEFAITLDLGRILKDIYRTTHVKSQLRCSMIGCTSSAVLVQNFDGITVSSTLHEDLYKSSLHYHNSR